MRYALVWASLISTQLEMWCGGGCVCGLSCICWNTMKCGVGWDRGVSTVTLCTIAWWWDEASVKRSELHYG